MRSALTPFRAAVALASLACATSGAGAQSWQGGFKAGLGRGSFTGPSEFTWQSNAFNAFGFLSHRASALWSRQIGIGLSQAIGVSKVGSTTLTFSADYVHVPLLLHLTAPIAFRVKPFLFAGPNLSFRTRCSLDFLAGSLSSKTPCDESPALDLVDVGVASGAGVDWTAFGTTFSIEGRARFNVRSVVVPLASSKSKSWSWAVLFGTSVPVSFGRRPPAIGPIPPGYVLAPSGTLPEALPSLPAVPVVSAPESARRVTVTAVDADARSLLIAIAREAGINVVVSADVRRRVSVSLTDASADEAIAAIIAQAGLSISRPAATQAAVVFYQLAVNVNQAPAEAIAVRFGTSAELARWIVESRAPKSDQP